MQTFPIREIKSEAKVWLSTRPETQNSGWGWFPANGAPHAVRFVWDQVPVDLGVTLSFDESGYGTAINDNGAIAGTGTGSAPGFYLENGNLIRFAMDVLGMNNLSHVVGEKDSRASLWVNDNSLAPDHSPSGSDERFVDLTDLGRDQGIYGDNASAINDHDQIVGIGNTDTALVWQNDKPRKLDDLIAPHPSFSLLNASAISQNGCIAANSSTHAFLLVPVALAGARVDPTTGNAAKDTGGNFDYSRGVTSSPPQTTVGMSTNGTDQRRLRITKASYI